MVESRISRGKNPLGMPTQLDTKEEALATSFMAAMGFNGVPPDDSIDGGVLGPSSLPEPGSAHTPSPQRISISRTNSSASRGSFHSMSSLSALSRSQSSPVQQPMSSPHGVMGPSCHVEVLWHGKMRTKDLGWFSGGSMWLPAELRGVRRINNIPCAQVVILGCARGGLETVPLSMVRHQSRGGQTAVVGEHAEGAEIVGGVLVWYCGMLQSGGDRMELCITGSDDANEPVVIHFPLTTTPSRLRAAPEHPQLTYDEAHALLGLEPPPLDLSTEEKGQGERQPSAETIRLQGEVDDELLGISFRDDEWSSSWHAQCVERSDWGLQGELQELSELLCTREAADLSTFARSGGFDLSYKRLAHDPSGGWAQCTAAKAQEMVEICLEALEVADAAVRTQASRFLLVCAIGLPRRNARACASVRKGLARPNVYYALVKALAIATAGFSSAVEQSESDDGANGQQNDIDPDTAILRRREAAAHCNLLFVVIGLLKTEMCPEDSTAVSDGAPERSRSSLDRDTLGKALKSSSDNSYQRVQNFSNIMVSRGEQDSITLPELLVELLSHAGAGPSRYPVPFKKFVCLLHRTLLAALPPPQISTISAGLPSTNYEFRTHSSFNESSLADSDFLRQASCESGSLDDTLLFPKCHVEEACVYTNRVKATYDNRAPRSLHEGTNLVMSRIRMWKGMRPVSLSDPSSLDIFDLQEMEKPEDCAAATLYSLLLLKLPALVVSLLKLLLAAGVNAKETTSPPVDDLYFDVDFEAQFLQGHEASIAWERHRRIVTSHAPACLLLMMKRWRHCHYLQAEYLARLVSDSNFLLLALKYLNQDCCQVLNQTSGVHEMDSEILAQIDGRCRFMHSVPPSSDQELEKETAEEGAKADSHVESKGLDGMDERWHSAARCRRSTTCMMAVLRMLQRVVKYSGVRIRTLVNLKAPLILRKPALLPNKILEKYSLKLFKSIGPFLGRKWKQNNGRILTRIFHTFPPDLHRDYLEPDTGSAEDDLHRDRRMRAATDEFNYRFFLMTSRNVAEKETPKDRVARLLASITVTVNAEEAAEIS